jgi:epsilon-lactone hydrolase
MSESARWGSFLDRPGHPASPELVDQRRTIATAILSGLWRTAPPATEVFLGGIRALRFDPPSAPRATVLHLHGGAFRVGAPETVGPFAAALAARCMATVICPAYRLAPEYPFPSGLTDVRAAMQALKRQTDHPVILSGDSAGGGLAASMTSLALAVGEAPEGLVLLSPWLDLTLASRCYEDNARSDPLFSRASAQTAADLYLQGVSPNHPLASPLLGDFHAFPKTLISFGSGEVLADDGRRLHAALVSAGVEAVLSEIPGMEHVAVTRSFELVGAAQTFAAIVAFVENLSLPA